MKAAITYAVYLRSVRKRTYYGAPEESRWPMLPSALALRNCDNYKAALIELGARPYFDNL